MNIIQLNFHKNLVILQILSCTFLIDYSYWTIFAIYIFMIEYVYIDSTNKPI